MSASAAALIVIDASVLANVVGDDGSDGRRARAGFRGAGDVVAPDLADVETVSVLGKRWLAGTVTDQRFAAAVDDLAQLDLERSPTLRFMRRAVELRANVTAYDSAYVALAEELGCDLLTADQRLATRPRPSMPHPRVAMRPAGQQRQADCQRAQQR